MNKLIMTIPDNAMKVPTRSCAVKRSTAVSELKSKSPVNRKIRHRRLIFIQDPLPASRSFIMSQIKFALNKKSSGCFIKISPTLNLNIPWPAHLD